MKKKIKKERPVCNLCGKNKTTKIWDKVRTWEYEEDFQIVQCIYCGLIFLSPRPVRGHISWYYPAETYWGDDVTSITKDSQFESKRRDNYGYLYETIGRVKKGSILDIGAGTGMFLSYFKDLGWEVSGVEFSGDACSYAKRVFNIPLKVGDFLDFKFPKEKYDIVTLNNSLEHLYDPKRTLEEIKKIMKKDGVLLITVPNIKSLGARIFGPKWYALSPPRHLYHFSPTTINSMMSGAGFDVVRIKYSYWMHNYFTIFESFRFIFSPRFKDGKSGEIGFGGTKSSNLSVKKEVGKIIFKLASFLIAKLGQIFGKGEVMVIYAKKR